MKNKGIGSDVAKTTKNLAKQVAKQAMQEPVEILKTAGSQATGRETLSTPAQETPQHQSLPETQNLDEEEINRRGKRIVQALEKEIEDIKRQKKEGEEAQEQIELKSDEEDIKPLPEISSKQSRGDLRGMKGKVKKLKTKAEIRMPPSG